jgi:glucosamine--fructose-6-phosphate aminotransferase (isomerizing)
MCGIVGIVERSNASEKVSEKFSEMLFRCIRNLEYRGYDSCGVALLSSKEIEIRKDIGSVDEVNKKKHLTEPQGNIGLAHTRWATHGGVTPENAHPHIDCKGNFAVVHNGIISNYRELRNELIAAGHQFRSETDTEIIPHLLEEAYKEQPDVEQALRKAFKRLKGTYAFAFITLHAPGKIFCARKESPLVLGIGTDNMFLASDINAFIEYTRDIVLLNDYEYAVISDSIYAIHDSNGEQISRESQHITWSYDVAQKGGFPTFMLKEVHEQPDTVRTVLNIDKVEIQKLAGMIEKSERTYLVGVGTTYYVSLVGQYYFTKVAKKFLPAISSDEFEYMAEISENSLFLCSSQSGETYDTLRALRFAKQRGVKSAAIVNVIGSSISREVDYHIMQGSGPEICVLSTKAAIAQIMILLRTALELGSTNKELSESQYQEYKQQIKQLPKKIAQVLDNHQGTIKKIVSNLYSPEKIDAGNYVRNWLFLGRGIYMATALEAALKMKEVTYLHAEGMSGGFMKHGTISLIDENMYTLVLVPPEEERDLYEATMSNVEEVKARGGFVIGFHYGKQEDPKFNEQVILPDNTPALIAPLPQLVAAQLFAYYSAVALGRNIDKPRSLAKSVTVP